VKEKVVLVTGSSSGIGAALCREFYRRGCRVIATARRLESIDALRVAGMQTVQLDVNDAAQIARCVEQAVECAGRVDVLVNNAGYGQMGPAIDVSDAQLRAQLECNLVAPLALTRAFAPVMRAQGSGLVVNMGSISGVVTTPFSGAYCASKAALHALDDALRMELAPFGIRVVTVQPGSVRSGFGAAALQTAEQTVGNESWYAPIEARILERANMSQVDATSAEAFAARLVSRLLRAKPPARIRLGRKSLVGPLVKRLLPRALLDRVFVRRFGLAALAAKKGE